MNAIEFQYRRIRQKYPNAPAIEICHGVAIDFYLRQGAIPTEVLVRSALARAESYALLSIYYKIELPYEASRFTLHFQFGE